MLEKFALGNGYTQSNWKEIPHEDGIADRLAVLTGKAEGADSARPDSVTEILH